MWDIPGSVEATNLVDDAKALADILVKKGQLSLDIVLSHPTAPTVIGLIFGLMMLYLAYSTARILWALRKNGKSKGKRKMPTQWNRMMVEDAIQDGLDNAFVEGKISGRIRKYYLQEIGRRADLPGLLISKRVRKLHPYRVKAVKDAIKDRMANLYTKLSPKLPADGPKVKSKLRLVSNKKEQTLTTKQDKLKKFAVG